MYVCVCVCEGGGGLLCGSLGEQRIRIGKREESNGRTYVKRNKILVWYTSEFGTMRYERMTSLGGFRERRAASTSTSAATATAATAAAGGQYNGKNPFPIRNGNKIYRVGKPIRWLASVK